ncbi:MAG: PDZ domain-containing protein [Deltaproteobacteria bacterium]|nr:PDZ domain-containing protein [Deltaproteobacteria bacterium]
MPSAETKALAAGALLCLAVVCHAEPAYDLSRMEAYSWVLLQMKQDYVDPSRVDPARMLQKTLEFVERRLSEVEITLEGGNAKVQVGTKQASFQVGQPSTVWEMNYNLQPVFKFIAENLDPASDSKEVEFAAINGMLSTLDPHSNLLPPELFREMRLKTTGEFGGLGIRISIRNGVLTIISPLPDTPAARMGLRAMDQIVRIEDQSTVNMPLDEAVNLLRGKPGSKVTIWVKRKGWTEPHKYVVTRETIRVRSVVSKLLDKKIGYIQIQDFSRHTGGDMLRHLSRLKREAKGLRGLVLDLRNNAGGLMKSAVQVADLFLDKGIIVATVSYSEDSTSRERIQKNREEQRADEDGVERDLPIVVLVNSGSASASEILAGALKNLDRAVLMGEQTFGKGTVQILNDRVPDSIEGACLKLTVAEYLIPGDVSIQETGVVPDIELDPVLLDADDIQIFAQPERFREADTESHLRMHQKVDLKPSEVVRFVQEIPEKQEGEEEEAALDDGTVKEDFEIKLARDFLLAIQTPRGSAMLDEGKEFLQQMRESELAKMARIMEKLKVNWAAGSGEGAAGRAEFKLEGEGVDKQGRAVADKPVRMKLSVQNSSSAPFYRLRAVSKCQNALFDKREFLFGRVDPGESRSWEVPIKIPRGAYARTDDLRFEFSADSGSAPPPIETRISTQALARPAFGFRWWLDDDSGGNGDGLIQPGEKIELALTVINRGEGKALETKALLQNEAGKDLFIEAGRGRLLFGEIEPAGSKTMRFEFRVRTDTQRDSLPVELTIWDSALGVTQVAMLELSVMRGRAAPHPLKLGLSVRRSRSEVRGGADVGAPIVAFARKGAVLLADRQSGDWFRLKGSDGPAGWIHTESVKKVSTKRAQLAGEENLFAFQQRTPPKIELEALPAYLERGESVSVKGRVVDEDVDIRDVAVWIGAQKVFLVSGQAAPNPRDLPFELSVKLKPGANIVTIMAREGVKYSSSEAVVITRPGGLEEKTEEADEEPAVLLR